LMARRLELARLLDRRPSRERALCLAMIVQRVLGPGSKLAMSRAFAQSTLAPELGVEDADEDELYAALDWLLARQPRIERALARRHLPQGTRQHATVQRCRAGQSHRGRPTLPISRRACS
jgi:hypothetical protein